MSSEEPTHNTNPFDAMRQVNDQNSEYWSGRDLAKILGYTTWRRFTGVLQRAEQAAIGSGFDLSNHFDQVVKMVKIGSGARRKTLDVHFQDAGYKGLYGELDRTAIKTKKAIPPAADLLDHAGTEELAANLFRATQTTAKLQREQPADKLQANDLHYETGRIVRQAIASVGNTPPEDLPAATPPIPELEEQERKHLHGSTDRHRKTKGQQ